jgi:hypothetical protein
MNKLKKFWSARTKLEKAVMIVIPLAVLVPILLPAGDTQPESGTQISSQDVNTVESLGAVLLSQLGEQTNEGVPRGLDVSLMEGTLFVDFALDKDQSNYLTLSTAWYAVDDIVQLVQLSGLAENLVVNGTLELIDKNGNSLGQGFVFTANFLDQQVPLLNTSRLLGKEAWEKAATSFEYHPTLLDEEK